MPPSLPPSPGTDQAPFDIDLRRECVIVCAGELDLAAAPALRSSLTDACRLAGDRVVIDLTDVTFLDCSAIGEMVRARSVLWNRDDDLTVRGLNAAARRVCTVVGLDFESGPPSAPAPHRPPQISPSIVQGMVQGIVEMWRAECVAGLGHAELLPFPDPDKLLSLIVAAVLEPGTQAPPEVLASITESCAPTEDADPALVLLQLITLGSVLRTWFGDRATSSRLHLRLNQVAEALVGSALSSLVDIGLVDPLTDLRNRRALDQDLVRFLAAAKRREQCLSVVMIDVEGLKAVNDRLGHAAGDELLTTVAHNLTATCRAGDQVYRVGGDEFVLVLPDLPADHIEAMMMRTRDGTAAAFTWGCAWTDGQDAGGDLEAATTLLETADRRMLEFRARRRSASPLPDGRRRGDERTTYLAGQIAGGARNSARIEQATGMLAQYFGAAMDDASDLLAVLAARRREVLEETAGLLVDGTIRADALAVPSPAGDGFSGTTGTAHGA